MPVAAVTAAMPPCPSAWASPAAQRRVTRSSSTGARAAYRERISSMRAWSMATGKCVRRPGFHWVSGAPPFHYFRTAPKAGAGVPPTPAPRRGSPVGEHVRSLLRRGLARDPRGAAYGSLLLVDAGEGRAD